MPLATDLLTASPKLRTTLPCCTTRCASLAAGPTSALAERIASQLNDTLGNLKVESFPDTETSVRIDEDVRGRDIFIVQPTCPPVNENLMELLRHPRRIQAREPVPRDRRPALLRLCSPRSQGPGPRADLGEAGRQSADRGRGESRLNPRSARRPDSGLFRHPCRSSHGGASLRHAHPQDGLWPAITLSSSVPTRGG